MLERFANAATAPLLSLLSTSAVAAARASVVFSNLLKAFSLTTCGQAAEQANSRPSAAVLLLLPVGRHPCPWPAADT